jgi:isoquinoline 1-oxidoreductase beta subunit
MQFRKDLCHNNPRALAVLAAIEEMSDWSRPREGTALGLSLAGYGETFAGGVAEVSVDAESGQITVHNFWLAADPGYVLQPRNTEAQLEGNVIFGISNALKEQITIKGGAVEQSNFFDYQVMRMNELPNIEVRALSTDNHPTGIGEIGLASTGAAIANAVYAATGVRVRELPMTPARVRAVLNA